MPRIRRCKHHGCHNIAYLPHHYCSAHINEEQQTDFKFKRSKKRTRYYNKVIRYRNPVKAEQNHFYHSKEWKTLRQLILNRDYHLCQYCKARNIITEGNIVDHVLPVEAFPEHLRDAKNLVTCCKECHYWKTRWEESYYGTGLHNKRTSNPEITDISKIATEAHKIACEKFK